MPKVSEQHQDELDASRCSRAVEEQDWLTARVRAAIDRPQLLLCHYRDRSVIFGVGQRPDDAMLARISGHGLGWHRRRAGGGTVFAGPWLLGVSLVIPSAHPLHALEPMAAYDWFGKLWQGALREFGVVTRMPTASEIDNSKRSARERGIDWACYGALGHGELITSEGRKLLGIAQVRTRTGTTLVAGLHLAATDWSLLCRLYGVPEQQSQALAERNDHLQNRAAQPPSRLLPELEQWFRRRLQS